MTAAKRQWPVARIHYCVLLWVCTCFFADVQNANDGQQNNQLLTESLHILGGVRNRVPRWTDPVRIGVVGVTDVKTLQKIRALANQISLFTGLNYRFLQHGFADANQYQIALSNSPSYDLALCNGYQTDLECANFVIIIATQSTMHQISKTLPMRRIFQKATAGEEDVACFFSPGVSANFEINRSVVFINSNLNQSMRHTCLQEEMVQSFGLFNDYSNSRYFSFNNVVSAKGLTAYDKMLLSSLYDRAHPIGSMAGTIANSLVEYCQTGC